MRTNKELKIALVVGAFMILFCLIMVLINSTSNKEIELKVYKNVQINGQRGYKECSVPKTILEEINTEFDKAKKLDNTKIVETHQIQGTYKLISGKRSIAFDDDGRKEIYNIEENRLYSFDSTIYTLVTTVCE